MIELFKPSDVAGRLMHAALEEQRRGQASYRAMQAAKRQLGGPLRNTKPQEYATQAATPSDGKPTAFESESQTQAEKSSSSSLSLSPSLSPKSKKQEPNRSKPSDARHEPFKQAVKAYCDHAEVAFTWDGSEGYQLAALLSAAPTLTLECFQECLNHRFHSDGVAHGSRPREWLGKIQQYAEGSLNLYNQVKGAHENGRQERFPTKTDQTLNNASEVLRELSANSNRLEPPGGATQAGVDESRFSDPHNGPRRLRA